MTSEHNIRLQWRKLKLRKVSLEHVRTETLNAMSQIDSLSNHKWHFFRKLLNRFDFESREFAVNRAFYKLWEILNTHTVNSTSDNFSTLSIAEAPGSFVQVIKRMFPNSFSIAMSKPPSSYADVVSKGKCIPVFSNSVLKLENCEFIYSDILCPKNISNLSSRFSSNPIHKNGFHLITADGGFDEEEKYDAKETLHYNLILGEIVLILLNQKVGGLCVLKIFESYTDTTLYLLWLLCDTYTSFDIIKPSTSRPTNAERYVVCTGFKGNPYNESDLLDLMETKIDDTLCLNFPLPDHFVEKMILKSKEFAQKQIDTINTVMEFVHNNDRSSYIDKKAFYEQKKHSFSQWKTEFSYKGM